MGPWLYYIDFLVYPLYAVAALALMPAGPHAWGVVAGGLVLGTLFEYVLHRWVLHGFFWYGQHELHHKRPQHHTLLPVWLVPSFFAVLSLPVILNSWWWAFSAGVAIWYTAYNVSHHIDHFYPGLWKKRTILHNRHHKLTRFNFGISTHLWDHVFGTYLG